MADEHVIPPDLEPEEWAEYQAKNEISQKEREKATAKMVEQENQEAPTEEG